MPLQTRQTLRESLDFQNTVNIYCKRSRGVKNPHLLFYIRLAQQAFTIMQVTIELFIVMIAYRNQPVELLINVCNISCCLSRRKDMPPPDAQDSNRYPRKRQALSLRTI